MSTRANDLLVSLLTKYWSESEDEIRTRFITEMEAGVTIPATIANDWRSFLDYWFHNAYKRLTRQERLGSGAMSNRARVAELLARMEGKFLDMVLPGIGKRLGEATFAECARCGGWLTKLSAMGKPRELVGDVLAEADVAEVFRQNRPPSAERRPSL